MRKTGKLKKKPKQVLKEEDSEPEMEYDETVYQILHNFYTNSSCLTFDIIPDNAGDNRKTPSIAYFIAGTQASHFSKNSLIAVKIENLNKKFTNNEDLTSSDSETEDKPKDKQSNKLPLFESVLIHHEGSINRLRVSQLSETIIVCSSWSESGKVHIWDLKNSIQALNDTKYLHKYRNIDKLQYNTKPLFTFSGHMEEGYAMDWSTVKKGRLATGDNKSRIHLWNMLESGDSWHVNQIPYASHTSSVEDIQWSPSEADVFASCSSDRSIKIWDVRAKPTQACMLTCKDAHESDVNVMSWNTREQYFLVSGGDEGALNIWDLREFKEGKPMAVFKYHTGPITSVEWKPDESSVFAASSADDKLSVWDLALERDEIPEPIHKLKNKKPPTPQNDLDQDKETEDDTDDIEELERLKEEYKELKEFDDKIPPYLLFLHEGQSEIKELHWHPQIPGLILDTALSGMNIFKPINI